MSFLGTFLDGQSVTFRVVWTLASGAAPITGSSLTLVSPSRARVVVPGVSDGVDTYKATYMLDEPGTWEARWATNPPGGVTDDEVYVDLT